MRVMNLHIGTSPISTHQHAGRISHEGGIGRSDRKPWNPKKSHGMVDSKLSSHRMARYSGTKCCRCCMIIWMIVLDADTLRRVASDTGREVICIYM
jgi:hypothetical protein